jgi:hypothetical protein
MSNHILDAERLERAQERLRQERETFDQRKLQAARWFNIRLRMGYLAAVLLPSVMALSVYFLINYEHFPSSVSAAASGALFVDTLGLVMSVWRLVLNPGSITNLEPVTKV